MSISISVSDGTALVTMDRAPVNALDIDTIIDLEGAFSSLVQSPPTAGVVLVGRGSVFSAGVDTRAFGSYDRERRKQMVLAITRMTSALLAIPVPVVAAVNGHALGGGFVLMLACDCRLASDADTIKLGMTEAQAGIPFPAGPMEIVRHELGPELLRRMTLASTVMTSKELHGLAVVDELSPTTDLTAIALRRAKTLAAQPGFHAVKQQIRGALAARVAALAASGQEPYIEAFL